jgi:hypothetical protein
MWKQVNKKQRRSLRTHGEEDYYHYHSINTLFYHPNTVVKQHQIPKSLEPYPDSGAASAAK